MAIGVRQGAIAAKGGRMRRNLRQYAAFAGKHEVLHEEL